MALKKKKKNLLEWVLCPWRWEESESGACSQAASLASGVCGPAVSHADRVPLRPPAQQILSSRLVGTRSILFMDYYYDYYYHQPIIWSLSNPVAERSVSRNRLCAYSVHIGAYLRCLSPSLFVAALIYRRDGLCWTSGWRRANTVLYTQLEKKPALRFCQNFTSPPQAAV